MRYFLDLLGLFLLLLSFLGLINFLNLRFVSVFALFLLLLLFLLIVCHLLLLGLLNIQLNREANEFRMLLDQILQASLLKELGLILLKVADNFGASLDFTMHHFTVLLNCERASCSTFPDVLFIIIVFADPC